ncbi:MAG: BamA/TamA family outer membrane protein [Siphonobacter sp.]
MRLFALSFFCFLTPLFSQAQPTDSVKQRVILVGDAGKLINGHNPVVDAIASYYNLDDPQTTLLYLGDNVYPRGLPDENDPDYTALAQILRVQAQVGLSKRSPVLFIPGNHDWSKDHADGWEKIKRQGRWLDSLHAPNIKMLPADGCPGPEEIHLNDRLILVIIDTQWWLHPNDKPGIDSDCPCKTEDEVVARLSDIVLRNKNKGIILATHQPFRSYGIHGGYYTLKQHIFPFTDLKSGLYIPLPLIGSIYPIARGVFGTLQDLHNPTYKHMVEVLEKALVPAKRVVFVAGHDHALQHIQEGNRNYLGSGSGINRERVKKGKYAEFVSSDWGYIVLDEMPSGELKASFFTVNEKAESILAHTASLFTIPLSDSGSSPQVKRSWPDSVEVAISPSYTQVSKLHTFLLGKNYREIWATPVRFPVFDIQKEGLNILQKGGGMQTKSLRLEDPKGNEWVLRTVDKVPEMALPVAFRETIARDVLQDEISAGYPYAPLAVVPLAEATHVPHAHPRLVYVPDDPALGTYQSDFARTICLLEERNPEGKSLSTPKVTEALEDDNDNQVDERAVLRARLLDLFIGDWDRHEDQWRWGNTKTPKGKLFYPIPRDRDQVFFKAGGLLPHIAAWPWLQPKFQGFRTKLSNVNGFMFNARYFDRMFLQGLSKADWEAEISDFEKALTDEVLQRAIGQLPPSVRQKSGSQILTTLKARRQWLREKALKYYRFLSKNVDITGSDKKEYFEISHSPTGQVDLSIRKIAKEGTNPSPFYHRIFDPSDTKEIRLYGLKGDDEFVVTGNNKQIKVRLIGGKGADRFSVSPHQPQKTVVYDVSAEANQLPQAGQAVVHTSTDKTINAYDSHAFAYDKLIPMLAGGYNLDDGLLLGAGGQLMKQGFRKHPYASMNRLLITHSLATNAFAIKYDGIFTEAVGKNDLWLTANIKAPDNVTNFYGTGNETVNDHIIRYYRTRYDLMNFAALLKRKISPQIHVSAGPVFQYFRLGLADNQGRFIEDYLATLPENRFLQKQSFIGLQATVDLDNRNDKVLPSRGIHWITNVTAFQGLGKEHNNQLTQLNTDLTVFTSFNKAARVVIVNRLGAGITTGNPAFYQLQYLGGQDNLRGYRKYRFAGDHQVYHNLELRLKLFNFRSYLFPGSVGLMAFNDIGRVWQKGESSKQWHDGYGGGIYISPASLLILTATAGFSDEGVLPYVSVGFRF